MSALCFCPVEHFRTRLVTMYHFRAQTSQWHLLAEAIKTFLRQMPHGWLVTWPSEAMIITRIKITSYIDVSEPRRAMGRACEITVSPVAKPRLHKPFPTLILLLFTNGHRPSTRFVNPASIAIVALQVLYGPWPANFGNQGGLRWRR